jgi:DNA-binding IclR family transcriptional regulator
MEKERLIYLKKDQHFNQLSEKNGKIYLTEVNNISKSGSIILNSETTHGVTDIAIPFGVKKINIVGSLTVTILSSQISETVTLQKILSKSKVTVENIYKNMGIN